MTLPLFSPADSPGPDFARLLDRLGLAAACARRRGVRPGDRTAPRSSRCATRTACVMAGDRRATAGSDIAHRNMDKVFPGRPVLRHCDRRCGGHRGRDGAPVPDPARALREAQRQRAVARGQGQPAGPDDSRQHADGHARPRRGAAVRRLRHAPRHRAHLHLRRHRRALRRVRLSRHGFRRTRRADHDQAGLARRT